MQKRHSIELRGEATVRAERLGEVEALRWVPCPLEELGPLGALDRLTSLTLGFTKNPGLGPLARLVHLEELDLGFSRLARRTAVPMAPLARLTSLKRLHVRSNQIEDSSPLASLTGLEALTLGDCGVAEVDGLAGMKGLRRLSLEGCARLRSIAPLGALALLESLDISGCERLESLEPLRALSSLRDLRAGGHRSITDYSPLASLPLGELRMHVPLLTDASCTADALVDFAREVYPDTPGGARRLDAEPWRDPSMLSSWMDQLSSSEGITCCAAHVHDFNSTVSASHGGSSGEVDVGEVTKEAAGVRVQGKAFYVELYEETGGLSPQPREVKLVLTAPAAEVARIANLFLARFTPRAV